MKSLNWKDEKRRGRSTSFVHNNLFPWKPSKGGRVCLVNLAQARKKAPNDLNSLQKDEELAKISTKDFSRDLFQINGISIKIVSKEIRMQRQLGGLPKRSHPWKSDCISSFSYCSWEMIGSGPFLKRSFDHSYKTNARPRSQVRRVNPSRPPKNLFLKKRSKQWCFQPKKFFSKNNHQVEGRVLPETIESWFDSGFWPGQVGSLVLFFLQSKSIQALGRPGLKYGHLGNPPIYKYAQIWTLSYFLDDTIKEAIH